MARVALEGIEKSYGTVTIIRDLDLTIDDGEFVVLVGSSGCGKSTTLRLIAGLETATAGSILIGDRDVTEIGPGQRNCAMVFQNYALYPHMTVADNIGFGMRLRGVTKAQIETEVRSTARILGLADLLERYPKALSGGQRQRVAIGRAMVRDPAVFLFDEPLSNLDAKLRIEMRAEIKELHRRIGKTIVYVTHDQVEAMTMADRVVVMEKGRIAQAATPLELYEQPANLFVAGFIGAPSMNFLAGEIGAAEGRPAIRLETGAVLPLADGASIPQALQPGQSVILGIRPEHAGRGTGPVAMDVRSVEPLGSHTLVLGRVGSAMVTVEADAHDRILPDTSLPLAVDKAKAPFFDAQTRLRLS